MLLIGMAGTQFSLLSGVQSCNQLQRTYTTVHMADDTSTFYELSVAIVWS